MKKITAFIIAMTFAVSVFAGENKEQLIEKAKARIPKINALLSSGNIALDSNGYLTLRGNIGEEDAAIVKEENMARKAMHQTIAKKNKIDIKEVEKRSVKRFRNLLPQNSLYQDDNGMWVQKK